MLRKTRAMIVVALLILPPIGIADRSARAQSGQRCFPETGFCIAGRIREFWEQNGALAVFGFPIGPQQAESVEGRVYQAQWFQRNRLELHPEKARPYDVLLGRLGDARLGQLGRVWQSEPRAGGPRAGCLWFPQTGHNVCNQGGALGFMSYWQQHGLLDPLLDDYGQSLALFGLPLTEPAVETNRAGDRVLTQWFERARFEWHPGEPDEFKVLLGLLGSEIRAGSPAPGPQPPAPNRESPLRRRDSPEGGAANQTGLVDPHGGDEVSCENGNTDIIQLDAGQEDVDLGSLPVPDDFLICLGAFEADEEIEVVVELPDGDTRRRELRADDGGNAEWRWSLQPGDQLGEYQVTATQGDSTASGTFTVRQLNPDEPRIVIFPYIGEPGTDFKVTLGGFQPGSDATLYLYYRCSDDSENVCYGTRLDSFRINDRGQEDYTLETEDEDPEGMYQIVAYVTDDGERTRVSPSGWPAFIVRD